MTSWVSIFSKFTDEALLFEAFILCALCASYAAFWILRKRHLGVIENEVPSNVVKSYLNSLILEAEQLRSQLFGILHQSETLHAPDFQSNIEKLELKIAAQLQAMENILSNKQGLENELNEAKNSSGSSESSFKDESELRKLREKIKLLEAKLAEYNLLEGDLTSLKKLQQENNQLRNLVSNPVAHSVAVAKVSESSSSTQKDLDAEAAFDHLVNQVEESLQTSHPQIEAQTESHERPSPDDPSIPNETMSQNDEELLSEFEKLLKD